MLPFANAQQNLSGHCFLKFIFRQTSYYKFEKKLQNAPLNKNNTPTHFENNSTEMTFKQIARSSGSL